MAQGGDGNNDYEQHKEDATNPEKGSTFSQTMTGQRVKNMKINED